MYSTNIMKKALVVVIIFTVILFNISVNIDSIFNKTLDYRNFFQLGNNAFASGTWTQKASGPASMLERRDHSAVIINNKMYIFGGKSSSAYFPLAENWEYDIINNSWTQKSPPSDGRGKSEHSAVVINNKMYVFGGDDAGLSNYTWEYNPSNNTWTRKANGPAERAGHSAVVINNKMYIFGGYDSSYNKRNDTWEYDPVTNIWTQKAAAPVWIAKHTAVAINNKMYIFGGNVGTLITSKYLYEYDPATNIWTQKASGPTDMPSRSNHTAVTIGNKMYIFGGNHLKDTWVYNPVSNTWKQDYPGPESMNARSMHTASVLGNKMYIFGGWDSSGYFKDTWEYAVNTDPIITLTYPNPNNFFSEVDSLAPVITVSDQDNDTLTCKYYLDAEATPRDTKIVTNTSTSKSVTFNSFNIGTLSEGNHTIKCETKDAFEPMIASVGIIVDKSPPILGTVATGSTVNSITISGSAIDNISGLDPNPYRFTIGANITSWLTSTSYTLNSLVPNTQYISKFEARDKKGHISTYSQNIYTKAQVPVIAVSNPSSYALDLSTNDNNPVSTQYQIIVNNTSLFVTPEGTLTSSPTWITIPNKIITVSGLSPSTNYSFKMKAKNAETPAIETVLSNQASGTTLFAPPGTPPNISATATTNSIKVEWNAVQDSSGFDIEVDGSIIDNGLNVSYFHTGLQPNTTHTYRVRAKNQGGPGNWSELITKTTEPPQTSIQVNCTIDKTYDIILSSNNMLNLNSKTFRIEYNPEELNLIDFYSPTPKIDLGLGIVEGTNLTITYVTTGIIEFINGSSISIDKSYYGTIIMLRFKSIIDTGQSTVIFKII
ncbi:MAG: hypothetical protein FIA99_05175 [Ruminiclostridium sp.]|nr:hypothetical protein [Ruminiclostridium sp.]